MLALLMTLALAADPAVSGTFRIDQSSSELETLHGAAVDATLASLPWALRGLARHRVKRVISNCTQCSVNLQTSQLTLTCDDEPVRVISLPAVGVTMTDSNGDPMTVTVVSTEAELTVTYATDEGGVKTRYRPNGDGLWVQKTLLSDRLTTPVVWEARYRRVP